jgi:hypothetical protein
MLLVHATIIGLPLPIVNKELAILMRNLALLQQAGLHAGGVSGCKPQPR